MINGRGYPDSANPDGDNFLSTPGRWRQCG